jgi:tRNA(Arg) A34 adenosine deaminase TadA
MRAEDDSDSAIVQSGKGRLGKDVVHPALAIENPGWVRRQIDWTREYYGDRDRMRVALLAAMRNVEQRTGGPFGAAIFEAATGRLVSIGVDLPVAQESSVLHAELNAIAMAQDATRTTNLSAFELHASTSSCMMCLGAALLARIPRIVFSTSSSDAAVVGLEPRDIPREMWRELSDAGVEIVHNILRDEGRDVLRAYRAARGRPAQD